MNDNEIKQYQQAWQRAIELRKQADALNEPAAVNAALVQENQQLTQRVAELEHALVGLQLALELIAIDHSTTSGQIAQRAAEDIVDILSKSV